MSFFTPYSNAYSTIALNRGFTADRASIGNNEETQKVKTAATNEGTSPIGQTDAAQKSVPKTESSSESTDRPQHHSSYPEKSTDSGKPRSASGDILDLSEQSSLQEDSSQEKDSVSISSGKLSSEKETESTKKDATLKSELTSEEQAQVEKLKARDAEVRTHEAAHMAAAGQYANGGPTYEYQTGPDGKKYAIGGSVSIDSSPISGNPEATIRKAQQVRAAALAPAEPSGQDQNVAAAASQMEAQARLELSRKSAEEIQMNQEESQSSVKMNSENEEQKENQAEISGMNGMAEKNETAENSSSNFVSKASQSDKENSLVAKSALESALDSVSDQEKNDSRTFQSNPLKTGTVAAEYMMNQTSFVTDPQFIAYA